MNNPAWQAIVPELVPHDQIPNAVTLNAASNNIARALGPALGGLMIAAYAVPHRGAAWVFALNSASFAGVIWILWRWKRQPIFQSALPAERIAGSVRSGLRYLRYAPDLQGPLIRAFTFTFFVSAVWSLAGVGGEEGFAPRGDGVRNSERVFGSGGGGGGYVAGLDPSAGGCGHDAAGDGNLLCRDDGGAGAGAAAVGGDCDAAGRGVCVDDDDVDAECECAT